MGNGRRAEWARRAARKYGGTEPEVSVDLELWNMIRGAKGLPAQTLAEAEAEMRTWIDSGAWVEAMARVEANNEAARPAADHGAAHGGMHHG